MENNLFLKIKNRYGLIYLSVISIFIILDIIASAFITNFLYEPNTNPLNLFLILFIPSTSIFVGIITIIKFILEAFKKKEGSHIKLVIVIIMALITILPSFIISYISSYIIKSNINLFINSDINNSIYNVIDMSNNEIINKQNSMLSVLSNVGRNYFNNIYKYIDFENPTNNFNNYNRLNDMIKNYYNFQNITFLSNSYYGQSSILFNTADFLPLDVNSRLYTEEVVFINSEYKDLFYVNAIIPLSMANNYVIWSEPMSSNYIEIRNNALESFRLYSSASMFLNEFSIILKLLYIFVLGISTFFSIIFGIILARLIYKPISLLLKATNSIINADFDIDMKFSGIHDLRNLIYRFNIMARALKYHRDRENTRLRLETWREAAIKVAHEIKNPLMPIVMNAEIIERNLKNNMSDKDIEKIKNSTTIIIKNANSISNLIKSFSEFSFAIKISDKKESINEVILEVLDSFKNIPNIKFKVSLTKHDYSLNMDRDKLIMSFRNLIKNSIEAMENNNIESIIYLSSYHEIIDYKEFFTVSITDTGIGIENNNIKRIFEPYFTSKSKGTGIGLATTEKIIMEHKGYISVESIIGEGSTFFIRFEI
ncbi:two-component sensor histidine kinase [Brachyspira aalborgi]|uniref:histidine kinase n=1 Tax=Brachyspira aalborgi TaxID=29522 RepID=A0A5C8GBT8_9SPIR|nr:ATP-binding protein [Brachyspira aalborgi]TXJ59433.1 two-component sensor histidine kinase [Brachyspira aalborgi]CCY77120.1 histidine kinase [Brachyspira sp. CAG:700]